MKKINLAITGCLGRMGQQLVRSSKNSKNFKLVSLTENRIINKKIYSPNKRCKCQRVLRIHSHVSKENWIKKS